jgi:DNA-binding transcriptional ArsR family regulator
MQILERAGLVDRQKEGKSYHFELRKEPLTRAQKVLHKLTEFWSERLDALAQVAESERLEAPTLRTRKREQ